MDRAARKRVSQFTPSIEEPQQYSHFYSKRVSLICNIKALAGLDSATSRVAAPSPASHQGERIPATAEQIMLLDQATGNGPEVLYGLSRRLAVDILVRN